MRRTSFACSVALVSALTAFLLIALIPSSSVYGVHIWVIFVSLDSHLLVRFVSLMWEISFLSISSAKVRRYVYHDVVRLGDLEKLIDCSYIQPYTINSAKVIFLNQRPQSRSCKGSSNNCFTCDRILQDPFHFCSLSCKVNHLVDQGDDLSAILYRIDESDFAFSQFEGLRMDGSEIIDDDGQITPSSIFENPSQHRGSSCSNEPEVLGKEEKKSGFLPGNFFSLSSRRKGSPHRAPLS
ncbi:hypothetical protein D5086_006540 [Populus alba]|uniref:Uncharacterized protein n=1 Tax=Populus alba TaxID=43335 RepID=A0ACC4CL14_POPAL